MKKYCIILTGMILSLSFNLFADNEADSLVAYSNIWKTAGCDSLTLTIRDIDITNIEPIVSFNTTTSLDDTTYFDSTIPNDDIDDSNVFNDLIDFLVLRKLNILEHIRINIPSGVYNFSNQIVMHSNISLKGAGSDKTEFRFLIKSSHIPMTSDDCLKNAVYAKGDGTSPHERIYNVGIEDLRIVREKGDDFSNDQVYDHVLNDDHTYFGNNISIQNATNCWVKGVESENTFRNHVALHDAEHVTISGVYFHEANKNCDGGFGYGVGLWDSSNNLVENSIFRLIRHAITIVDGSWYNVIAYNYAREERSVLYNGTKVKWSDIAIHGESTNTYFHNYPSPEYEYDPNRKPYYNLIEGNNLDYLCVDATHRYNGTHNSFLRNRVTQQIHVQGSSSNNHALLGFATDVIVLATFPTPLAAAWILSTLNMFSGACVHCLAFQVNDLRPNVDNFRNQPRQLFINNYARECNWWKSQILDYPVRMHSTTSQFQANTRKHYATWWGGTKRKTIHRSAAFDYLKTCYILQPSPAFWPTAITWPYDYKKDQNPAQQRWHSAGKPTIGPDDPVGYVIIHEFVSDSLYVFTEDFIVKPGELMKIHPRATITVKHDKKIVIYGELRAEGTATNPITFTCSDPTSSWGGIEVRQQNKKKPLPSIKLNNCIISRANQRAILLDTYSEAIIDSCKFEDNFDHGAISSLKGKLSIANSVVLGNNLFSNSQKNGVALCLKDTDAHVSNTIITGNVTKRHGTGAVHIEEATGDETRNIVFHNCYFSENAYDGTPNGNYGLAIHSADYEGTLSLYNCSFINQPQEIFSKLKNDFSITNSLFCNVSGVPHFINSDRSDTLYTYKISKSFIPDYELSPNIVNITKVDTIYTGDPMLVHDTESNLYSPRVISPFVNAGDDEIRMLGTYVATDLLGNPRYCGASIDIGAIEVMKPEFCIRDTLFDFSIDFGSVPVFQDSTYMLRVTNTGTEPLVLSNPVFPTDGYTIPISFPCTIEAAYTTDAGEDWEEEDEEQVQAIDAFIDIPITFKPIRHSIDYLDKLITFATNDSLNSLISINVSGIGTAAELSVSADTLRMMDFPANNTPSFGREFSVFKNTGNIALVIDSLYVTNSLEPSALFQYAVSSDTPQENKQSPGTYLGNDIRAAKTRSDSPQRQARQIADIRAKEQPQMQVLKREPSKGGKDLTWYDAEHNHTLELAPGDSIFVHTRYIPFLIGADEAELNVRSNDAYERSMSIPLFGDGIALVVTSNPTEIQVSNVITADTLWVCPQIEIKSNVEVEAQARLTIQPYKKAVSIVADSSCAFNVSGELQARRSLNQIFSISFAGVDSLAGWKGFVFKDNPYGESRLDSLAIVNTNDYSRFEEGGGAIHSHNYHNIQLSNVVFENSQSQHNGGSIHVINGELKLLECSIIGSTALQDGGAISVMGNGSNLTITGSTLSGNSAQRGGAISAIGSDATINESIFSDNTAQESGGAVYLEDTIVSLERSVFTHNTSIIGGALAIAGNQSNVAISSGAFNENGDLSCTGGSIHQAGGQLAISDSTSFTENKGLAGGAITVVGATASMTIENASFIQNQATIKGGAIASTAGSVEVKNSVFDGCSVEAGSGGAIALFEADYLISGNRFTHCRADSVSGKGGSIYIENSSAQKGKGQSKDATTLRELSSNEIKQSHAYAGGAIYQTGDGDVISNAIYQNNAARGAGIYLKDSVGQFENNTIANNVASGVGWAMLCESLGAVITNTIIWSDTLKIGNPIHCINAQNIDLLNCAIEDTLQITSGTLVGTSIQDCITDHPIFDSESSVPYQLLKTSLCVNAGTRDSSLDGYDAAGKPRINSDHGTPIIDIGAYEFMGPYWVCTRDTIPDLVEITYSPTYFINDLEITNTGTLHVDPGVSLLAQNNTMIKVSGSIEALGTENSGIVFGTAPGNDAWYGFSFLGEASMGSSAFTHCAFLNGKAYPDGSHSGNDASNGGLMYIDGYPSIELDYCAFGGNQALDNGGAIYLTNLSPQDSLQITNSSFSGNRVKKGTGGAICSIDSKLQLHDNSFGSNSAGYPLDPNVTPEAIYAFCGGAVSLITNGYGAIEHSILDNQFYANSAAATGGGIYAQAGNQRIIGNQFSNGIALSIDKKGERSDNYGGGAIGIVSGAISEIAQNTFDSNYAYAGGAILNDGSVSNVADNTFNRNKAQFGGAIQLINIDTGNSLTRNLFTTNGTADSTNCQIGGAIRMLSCHPGVEISLSKFTGNSSNGIGGAIAIQESGGHILANNQISNNNAVEGGGLYLEDSEVSLSNNTIAHNASTESGGGIFIDGSRLESINNLHWSNSAPTGFEVQLTNASTMSVYNSFIRQTSNAVECPTGSLISYAECCGETDQPPQLINDSYNYNLRPDSPCVNSGEDNTYHTMIDLNYRNRVVGGIIDIGAYEYSGTTINADPEDSLTVWDDTCITISSPITLSEGKKLIIEDNVSVFFAENGSLDVQAGILEAHNNVSFASGAVIPGYHIRLKEAAPVTLFNSSILGVKLKADATFMNIENSIFDNSFLSHNDQSLVIRDSEFSASNLDAVNTWITNDTLMVSITGSHFHDKPDSTAIRIYSYPNFQISDNVISNYYTGLSLFESGQGKFFSLCGNSIEGNQYGYGIQAYHSNVDMNSFGTVKNNYIGLGGLRNSSIYLVGNEKPPFQSFCNNYFDEMAFTHDSFPKDIRLNLIYDSLHPVDTLIRCSNCDYSNQHDVSYNYWNISDPNGLLVPEDNYTFEPLWELDENLIPEICADQDLFELAKYNLRIGHNDLAVIQFKDLIENYPDTKYMEDAAKLLMAAGGSSSNAIYDLQHFYATEPNLHNEIGIEKLADYLVNYCNLKLEEYQAVIDWYEDIITNPPTAADSIFAVIDLAYTYLLMNADDSGEKSTGQYSQYVPLSMQTFRRDLDGYINQLLQSTPTSSYVSPVPSSFALHQNYPNPFNPTTTISFDVPDDAPVQLAIYNIRGQLVKDCSYASLPKGKHRFVWDSRDRNGVAVGSGIYLYRVSYRGQSITKKMCIMK